MAMVVGPALGAGHSLIAVAGNRHRRQPRAALPGEAELVTGQGMAYAHIPVEWEDPRPQQFAQFVGLLNAFAGRKAWVHCAMNMRVSAFIYLYRRLVLAEGEEQAAFPMRVVWSPNETWQAFISQVCAEHANHARPAQ
jgi:protein tyrosine phosphatase (PTP) superfamily phosphohydrolase (DUF442 family)